MKQGYGVEYCVYLGKIKWISCYLNEYFTQKCKFYHSASCCAHMASFCGTQKAITQSYHLASKCINHTIEKSSQGLKNKFTFYFTEKKKVMQNSNLCVKCSFKNICPS